MTRSVLQLGTWASTSGCGLESGLGVLEHRSQWKPQQWLKGEQVDRRAESQGHIPWEYQYLKESQRTGSPRGRQRQNGQSGRRASQDTVAVEAREAVSFMRG